MQLHHKHKSHMFAYNFIKITRRPPLFLSYLLLIGLTGVPDAGGVGGVEDLALSPLEVGRRRRGGGGGGALLALLRRRLHR